MFDAHDLFKSRLSAYIKETSRYLKYIFNGHIAIALFFLIAAVSVYYQQWLNDLPKDFPTAWIIGILFGFLATHTPIRTLLQEPDLVFLIPAEHKMKAYFKKSLLFSYIHQIMQTLFIVAAVSPLYFHTYVDRSGSVFLLTILVLFIFKAWNTWMNWSGIQIRNIRFRFLDQIIRYGLNIAVFYTVISGSLLWSCILTITFIVYFIYRHMMAQKQVNIAWDILVENDQHHMEFFYRIANMFTDVPHLRKRFKKRTWFVGLVSRLPFLKKHTYDYLYRITFIRSGDYLGMYIRLIILGMLSLYFVPNELMKLIFGLLFIYMSMFQMITLYQHYRTNIWLDIYPLTKEMKQKAIITLLYQLTIIQTIIFTLTLITIKLYMGGIILFFGGLLFMVLFMNGYVKRKIA